MSASINRLNFTCCFFTIFFDIVMSTMLIFVIYYVLYYYTQAGYNNMYVVFKLCLL